jgi:hypothetical protein
MQYREYTTHKRDEWLSGPWDGEPDKVQWQDESTQLPCLAVRNHMGAWCGYVGVAADHPLYRADYTRVDAEVHGGLTFANHCSPGDDESVGICHVPDDESEDNVWWFGFDCAHSNDLIPGLYSKLKDLGYRNDVNKGTYRTLGYVKTECQRLASQLVFAA